MPRKRSAAGARSETAAWVEVARLADEIRTMVRGAAGRLDLGRVSLAAEDLLELAGAMQDQLAHGVHRNPALAVWGNPPATGAVHFDQQLSERVYEIRYRHVSDRLDYKHEFARGVDMWTIKHGSSRDVLLMRPDGKSLWDDF